MNSAQRNLVSFRSEGVFDFIDRPRIMAFASAVSSEAFKGQARDPKVKVPATEIANFIDAVVNAEKFRYGWKVKGNPDHENAMNKEIEYALAIVAKYGF